jgi:geranylgeranyl pyrophosphate synthase
LQAELANRLVPVTLSLFGDLDPACAKAVAELVNGGKRLRAAVVLAVCDALAGNRDHALRYASAIECVHAASLVHDDLVDDDRMRRGHPAAWVVQGARRAVLLADVMFATALQRTGEIGKQGVVTIARAISMLAAGAYGEPLTPRDVDPLDRGALYERTIRLKSGSLFSAAAELGAIAAGARPAIRRAASEFGMRIGEAYQIADDLDDIVHGERASGPQETAMLAALLAYFGQSDFDAARLSSAMEADIDRRLALAREALGAFAQNSRTALLRQMPRAIVRLSLDRGDDRGAVQRQMLDSHVAESTVRELGG